ncbi:transcription termination factor Rho [candidate division CPR3 bacterium 4484_211]|uniref:Transcription termination factor Rho n=1 Tax=candidate division CPR3 bacterium 4484_211 TaxID=1968527 RepID=A0A1W9NXQ7_UNCC3|nr:MAG: transcription termination factor Rho [candidate division CPR3 bacterium 4484_211]
MSLNNNSHPSTDKKSGHLEKVNSDFSPETETEEVTGVLEILPDFGFLRRKGFGSSREDVYISSSQVRRFELRQGDVVKGIARPPKEGEKYWGLLRVDEVNGLEAERSRQRPRFEDLTPIFPREKIVLETKPEIISTRLLDLVAPIGRGQRGLIVSPPKAGKTWLMKDIANGLTTNYDDIDLMVVLIGERPEEVTDMERSVQGEVIASNFDEPPEEQVRVADLALDKAKRAVEMGRDVFMLVDSITRLARAHNLNVPPSGRTLSGGFDPAALYPPKRFFGAARNLEDGGSLTIIATALVDTGSRMDDLIYEEFKGTGNMEIHLDRRLANRRVWPAIDVLRSGTRREELLFSEEELKQVWRMHKMLDVLNSNKPEFQQGIEATQLLIQRIKKTKTNKEFLETLHEEIE